MRRAMIFHAFNVIAGPVLVCRLCPFNIIDSQMRPTARSRLISCLKSMRRVTGSAIGIAPIGIVAVVVATMAVEDQHRLWS